MLSPTSIDSQYRDYVGAYLCAIEQLPCVERVYVDTAHGLRIYTIYRGSVFEVGEALARAEGEVMDRFPRVAVDFQFIPADAAHGGVPAQGAHQVFPAA